MNASGHTRERLRTADAYERFFDDLYHMGRPADIFDAAPPDAPKGATIAIAPNHPQTVQLPIMVCAHTDLP